MRVKYLLCKRFHYLLISLKICFVKLLPTKKEVPLLKHFFPTEDQVSSYGQPVLS